MKGMLKQQQGAETLEFMVVFLLFMVLIMTIFDFARALYVWNALTEATRRGARMAIVCPNNTASQTRIKNVAVFDTPEGSLGSSPVVNGLTTAAITIRYYNAAGNIEPQLRRIQFAEVSINTAYQFQFIIPGFNQLIDAPTFTTTLYAEGLGAVPTYPDEAIITPRCDF